MEKEPPDWYLARSIGQVIHTNPDLQNPPCWRKFPQTFATPMDEMLWLPEHPLAADLQTRRFRKCTPQAGAGRSGSTMRDRAVDLYLKQLKDPKADRRLRQRSR